VVKVGGKYFELKLDCLGQDVSNKSIVVVDGVVFHIVEKHFHYTFVILIFCEMKRSLALHILEHWQFPAIIDLQLGQLRRRELEHLVYQALFVDNPVQQSFEARKDTVSELHEKDNIDAIEE